MLLAKKLPHSQLSCLTCDHAGEATDCLIASGVFNRLLRSRSSERIDQKPISTNKHLYFKVFI